MRFLDSFGAYGYGLTAVLFLLLAVLLLTSWRGRMQGGLLVAAAFASALWAGVLAVEAAWNGISATWIWALESLRDFAWILFLLRLLEQQLEKSRRLRHIFAWLKLCAVALAVMLVLPIEELTARVGLFAGIPLISPRLALALIFPVAGLVLVEQVYRNAPSEHRWGLKFLCLGVGGLFSYDFFLFADALLFGRLDSDLWQARGAATAFVVPLVALSAVRNPQWSFDLFVSRKVVFHTTSLVAAGIYLLTMGIVGYYIHRFGGQWSSVLQTVFLFGAALVLVVLLFSGHFRSRMNVLINKHFFRYKYDYREEWLHLISVLSGKVLQATLPERIVFALGELVDSPGGAIWLCHEESGCALERCWRLDEEDLDRRDGFESLQGFFLARRWIVNLDEYQSDPALYRGLQLPQWLLESKHLWLIVPLFHDDTLLGFVLLIRPRVQQQLNWETLDLLKTSAKQASSYLALDQAARALADARQFEGFNRLSAFVVHDLKNLIAQLSLVTRNAERHKSNPAFMEDAIDTVRNSVDKMNRLLVQLRSAMPGKRADRIRLGEVLREVVSERATRKPEPRLQLLEDGEDIVYADKDRLAAVIGHVVQNAQEATRSDGTVTVCLKSEGHQALIEVEDNGVGMDAAFIRERLFKPFDSTKGLAGMGIGAYECREFIRTLGGRIEVLSTLGEGTLFRMIVPLGEETDHSHGLMASAG